MGLSASSDRRVHAERPNDWQALSDRCRHANMGYRDGVPGTLADVERRLRDLERFGRQDGRVIARFMSNPDVVAIALEMADDA